MHSTGVLKEPRRRIGRIGYIGASNIGGIHESAGEASVRLVTHRLFFTFFHAGRLGIKFAVLHWRWDIVTLLHAKFSEGIYEVRFLGDMHGFGLPVSL